MQNNAQSHRDQIDPKVGMAREEPNARPNSRGLRAECHPVDDAAPIEAKQELISATKKATISGVVTDCVKLNVHKEPSPDAEVVAVIELLSEVAVDMDASSEGFYKICTVAGIEGYCMKKYIALPR